MMFWIREVVGWVLVALGLYVFKVAYFDLVTRGLLVQTVPVVFMGFIIFRGGIHLVKVAIAIRISREAIRETKKGTAGSPAKLVTERRQVVPGAPAGRN
jgi:hypothetical protein